MTAALDVGDVNLSLPAAARHPSEALGHRHHSRSTAEASDGGAEVGEPGAAAKRGVNIGGERIERMHWPGRLLGRVAAGLLAIVSTGIYDGAGRQHALLHEARDDRTKPTLVERGDVAAGAVMREHHDAEEEAEVQLELGIERHW